MSYRNFSEYSNGLEFKNKSKLVSPLATFNQVVNGTKLNGLWVKWVIKILVSVDRFVSLEWCKYLLHVTFKLCAIDSRPENSFSVYQFILKVLFVYFLIPFTKVCLLIFS